MTKSSSHVSYVNGKAEVQFGNRSFLVAGHDAQKSTLCCPIELAIGALGSWITLTIAAVADRKEILVEKIDVHIDYDINRRRPWRTAFNVRIDLGSELTRRERTILFNVARTCEVYKMLTGEITCEYQYVK